jgi:ABC-2 type transport system ATP-binding protein
MGKTVFFSTHILQDVELICDRVAILIKGALVSVGRLDEILNEEVESIEVTVRDLAPDAMDSIRKTSVNVVGSSDRSMIIVKDEESLEKVQAAIRRYQGMIVSIIPRRRTLEEHFIEKTRE